ncbi:endolysin [Yersinia phage fHe-Yen8-01]|nr:endolysin [Yersinia phage fHe-Yen8-01]
MRFLALWVLIPAIALGAVPPNAEKYLPILVEAQRTYWPEAPIPSFLGAQVEQESCISLKHPKCWSPTAELKTSREWGIGLGQFTRAYKADGSIRFDKISELAATHKSLNGWSWENRYDAHFQLTAIVEMDKAIYSRQKGAATERDRLSFTLSAYNGGEGGVLQDRRLCANTKGCDSTRWAGHVENTSLKAKAPKPGYKVSFFKINREYVTNILDVRRAKYIPYFE